MRHIAAKLRLAPGQRVLDIGSDWGGLGLYLARQGEGDVTGVTLSVEQQKYAAARAKREGLADRARFATTATKPAALTGSSRSACSSMWARRITGNISPNSLHC